MNEELVRTQYVIMRILRTNKATNYIRGITLAEIADKDTVKKNLTATSECRLTGSIDFLGDIAVEKPKPEKKKSNRDWLFM